MHLSFVPTKSLGPNYIKSVASTKNYNSSLTGVVVLASLPYEATEGLERHLAKLSGTEPDRHTGYLVEFQDGNRIFFRFDGLGCHITPGNEIR